MGRCLRSRYRQASVLFRQVRELSRVDEIAGDQPKHAQHNQGRVSFAMNSLFLLVCHRQGGRFGGRRKWFPLKHLSCKGHNLTGHCRKCSVSTVPIYTTSPAHLGELVPSQAQGLRNMPHLPRHKGHHHVNILVFRVCSIFPPDVHTALATSPKAGFNMSV